MSQRAVLIACLAYLALSAAVAQAAEGPPGAVRLDVADPAAAGMEDCRQDLARRLEQFVAEKKIAGAVVLVLRRGQVGAIVATGLADLAKQRSMQPDAIFQVASMTKPITATAVMILQDEGKLSVDEPVSKYIPSFKQVKLNGRPPAREITLRDLMTHTSGIGIPETKPGAALTLAEQADAIAAAPLRFEPGSKWQYGNGLSVCGRVIEVVSGVEYAEFVRQRIFAQLDMRDTGFWLTPEQRERIAVLYKPADDKRTLVPVENFIVPGDVTKKRTPNPSGGLFSTARDIAIFYETIRRGGEWNGRRIVSAAAVKQMTSPQTGDLVTGFTPGNCWGLGWCIVREPQGVSRLLSPGAYGHGGAHGTQVWVDPTQELVMVLMIQRTGFGNSDGSDIRDAVQEIAIHALKK